MFKTISWSSYIVFMVAVLIAYYLYVLIRYYRKDIVRLFSSRKSIPSKKTPRENDGKESDEKVMTDAAHFPVVYELLEDLKEVFQKAASSKWIKEELLMALEVKIRAYPQLKGTAFQVAVNNHIAQQATVHCGITLTDDDLKPIW